MSSKNYPDNLLHWLQFNNNVLFKFSFLWISYCSRLFPLSAPFHPILSLSHAFSAHNRSQVGNPPGAQHYISFLIMAHRITDDVEKLWSHNNIYILHIYHNYIYIYMTVQFHTTWRINLWRSVNFTRFSKQYMELF